MAQDNATQNDIVKRNDLTPQQARLVQQKISVLAEARDLQAKLASSRAELTRIDAEMLDNDFQVPVLACW